MTSQAASTIPSGTDPVTDWLRANNLPVTRQNWIEANWLPSDRVPWTAEHEAQLPKPLRLIQEPTDDDLTDLLDKALAAREQNLRNAATLVRALQATEEAGRERRRAQWREAQARRRAKMRTETLDGPGTIRRLEDIKQKVTDPDAIHSARSAVAAYLNATPTKTADDQV